MPFVRGCLFNTFAATLHSWRPFLHPELEDAPCCGDRDLPNMVGLFPIEPFIFFFKIKPWQSFFYHLFLNPQSTARAFAV
jgi:hypothetical protein